MINTFLSLQVWSWDYLSFWVECRFRSPSNRPLQCQLPLAWESACRTRLLGGCGPHTGATAPLGSLWALAAGAWQRVSLSRRSCRLAGMPRAPQQLSQRLFPGGEVQGPQSLILLQLFPNWKLRDTPGAVSSLGFLCLFFFILNLTQASRFQLAGLVLVTVGESQKTRGVFICNFRCALGLLSVRLG